MERVGRWARVRPERHAEYVQWHRQVPDDLVHLISAAGIRNYTIFSHGCDLFSYLEVDDWDVATERLRHPLAEEWQKRMAPLMEAADPIEPWKQLPAIFRID